SVVGVTFDNDDGSSRQDILATCESFQPLRLEHEEHNPYDANAIAVCTKDGRQIGHLSRDLAADVWWRMQHHFTYAAIAADINHRTEDRPTIGMNLLVLVARPGVSQEQMQDYLDSIKPDVVADVLAGPPDDYGDEDDDDEQEQEFTMRGGKMVPTDEVFSAWISRDLQRMLKAMDLDTNPIDRHFLLLNIVTETYRLRANPKMAEVCLRVAQTHLAEFPQLLPFLNQEFPDRLLQVPTFQHYATVLVERDRFSEAIQVCEAAIGFGLQDGTKGGYKGRIERIKKKQQQKMITSDHSCDD
ncbi:MAG: HIRAN domain-containing protein, partial [Phycisphaerae bacterium]|nr:HIRAN domain-containing protein [Phycisphaerae bacterium]